jgi:GNAT superfamily N-acetyltransferase
MSHQASYVIRQLRDASELQLEQLAEVLIDCVNAGASVSFMHPLSLDKAIAFWRGVAADAQAGKRILIVAEYDGGIIGTVQLIFPEAENQPHRADVAKMLVHRRGRRRGVGAALMRAAEEAALAAGKTVLVLDTASDDAERLYVRCGWTLVGTVPDYALLPHGGFCATRFYYRRLTA